VAFAAILSAIGANIEVLHIILFAIGIICMVVEMLEPGMGVFGIVGVIVMVIDIFILAENFVQGLVLFAGLAIIVVIFIVLIVVLSSYGILPKSLVLKESTNNESGYTAASEIKLKVGDKGVALTDLRPAGKAEFGYVSADVVSHGEFVVRGAPIEVITVNGNKIVVKETDGDE